MPVEKDEFQDAFDKISAADNENTERAAAAAAKGDNVPKDIETPGAAQATEDAAKATADAEAAKKVADEAAAAEAAKAGQTDEQKAAADAEAAKAAEDEKARAAAAAAKPQLSTEDFMKRFVDSIDKVVDSKIAPKVTPQPAKPEYTAEEETAIVEFAKEYPEINTAMALQRRSEYTHLLNHVFGEVRKTYDGAIRELTDVVQTLVNRTQVGDIRSIEPEYDNIRDKVVAWVQTQPHWLQPGLAHVIREGTTDEVQQLIGMWKASTGYKVAGAGGETAEQKAAAAKAAEVEAAKTSRAAAALAPTPAKRSNAVLQAEPQTFEDAFAAFSAAEAAKDAAGKR